MNDLTSKDEIFEYKMTRAYADAILKTRKNKKIDPQPYLIDYVNSLGLKGTCINVLVDL